MDNQFMKMILFLKRQKQKNKNPPKTERIFASSSSAYSFNTSATRPRSSCDAMLKSIRVI